MPPPMSRREVRALVARREARRAPDEPEAGGEEEVEVDDALPEERDLAVDRRPHAVEHHLAVELRGEELALEGDFPSRTLSVRARLVVRRRAARARSCPAGCRRGGARRRTSGRRRRSRSRRSMGAISKRPALQEALPLDRLHLVAERDVLADRTERAAAAAGFAASGRSLESAGLREIDRGKLLVPRRAARRLSSSGGAAAKGRCPEPPVRGHAGSAATSAGDERDGIRMTECGRPLGILAKGRWRGNGTTCRKGASIRGCRRMSALVADPGRSLSRPGSRANDSDEPCAPSPSEARARASSPRWRSAARSRMSAHPARSHGARRRRRPGRRTRSSAGDTSSPATSPARTSSASSRRSATRVRVRDPLRDNGENCGYCSKPCVSNQDCYTSDTGLVCDSSAGPGVPRRARQDGGRARCARGTSRTSRSRPTASSRATRDEPLAPGGASRVRTLVILAVTMSCTNSRPPETSPAPRVVVETAAGAHHAVEVEIARTERRARARAHVPDARSRRTRACSSCSRRPRCTASGCRTRSSRST